MSSLPPLPAPLGPPPGVPGPLCPGPRGHGHFGLSSSILFPCPLCPLPLLFRRLRLCFRRFFFLLRPPPCPPPSVPCLQSLSDSSNSLDLTEALREPLGGQHLHDLRPGCLGGLQLVDCIGCSNIDFRSGGVIRGVSCTNKCDNRHFVGFGHMDADSTNNTFNINASLVKKLEHKVLARAEGSIAVGLPFEPGIIKHNRLCAVVHTSCMPGAPDGSHVSNSRLVYIHSDNDCLASRLVSDLTDIVVSDLL